MKFRLIIIIIVTLLFDGLHNYRELNNLIIVSSIGVDKEDDNYIISAQVIDTKKKDEEKVNIFKSEGKTIHEALRNMTSKSSKRLYLAHTQEMVISEDVAREGIDECIDFLVRDNEVSMNVMVVVARNCKAFDVLSTLSPTDNIPSNHLKESILSSEEYIGNTFNSTLKTSLDSLIDDNKVLNIASCKVEGKEEEKKVVVSNIAFFKNHKIKGYLSYEDSIIYNLFNNNIKNSLLEVVNDKYKFTFEIVNPKCNIRPYYNGKFNLYIDISSNANITEKSDSVKVNSLEDIKDLENEINLFVKDKINKYLYNINNLYNLDISSFSKIFYRDLNNKFNLYNNFKDINYKVNVNIKLKNEGGFVKKW